MLISALFLNACGRFEQTFHPLIPQKNSQSYLVLTSLLELLFSLERTPSKSGIKKSNLRKFEFFRKSFVEKMYYCQWGNSNCTKYSRIEKCEIYDQSYVFQSNNTSKATWRYLFYIDGNIFLLFIESLVVVLLERNCRKQCLFLEAKFIYLIEVLKYWAKKIQKQVAFKLFLRTSSVTTWRTGLLGQLF